MQKKYLDYAGLKRVLAKLLPGNRKIWHGTWDEWETLAPTEKAKYDQAELHGNFNYEQFVIDDAIDNTDNPITSDAVDKAYNEAMGNLIASVIFYGTAKAWRNNIPVAVNNVAQGKYLIIGRIFNNSVGILDLRSVSSGILRGIARISNSSATGDILYNMDIIGFYEQTDPGTKNVTFNCNVYSNGSTRAAEATVYLWRID